MNCRSCDAKLPKPFLDLGKMPLANSYLTNPEQEVPQARLAVSFCKKCYLVQLADIVPPEVMFTDYSYSSGFSDIFMGHLRDMFSYILKTYLPSDGKVLEIGSNDGSLLKFFKDAKHTILGVDPASNIVDRANKAGITTLCNFFNLDLVPTILNVYGRFDVIIGNNVLAHVPNICDFLTAVRKCLKVDGVALFEFPYLPMLMQNLEFDTIYHEHVFYYSIIALKQLLFKHALEIIDIRFSNIHGGSIQVAAALDGTHHVNSVVSMYEYLERRQWLDRENEYSEFATEVKAVRDNLLTNLGIVVSEQGKTVAAYGAPAKGNTLLNYCGIKSNLINFTVDRSPDKQGKFLPGSKIPIYAPEELVKRMPDYCLILPWNIADEIQQQQSDYIKKGGKFVIPVPYWKVLNE